jgi:hypothetical protein
MKPNALRFGAVGTLPLISAGKPIPGGGQVSVLMAIFLSFRAVVRTRLPEECRPLRLTLHRARAWGSKMEIPFLERGRSCMVVIQFFTT